MSTTSPVTAIRSPFGCADNASERAPTTANATSTRDVPFITRPPRRILEAGAPRSPDMFLTFLSGAARHFLGRLQRSKCAEQREVVGDLQYARDVERHVHP